MISVFLDLMVGSDGTVWWGGEVGRGGVRGLQAGGGWAGSLGEESGGVAEGFGVGVKVLFSFQDFLQSAAPGSHCVCKHCKTAQL